MCLIVNVTVIMNLIYKSYHDFALYCKLILENVLLNVLLYGTKVD